MDASFRAIARSSLGLPSTLRTYRSPKYAHAVPQYVRFAMFDPGSFTLLQANGSRDQMDSTAIVPPPTVQLRYKDRLTVVCSFLSTPPHTIARMPSLFAAQETRPKRPSRPATSLLRRFNDLYKPSASPLPSLVSKSKHGKNSKPEKTTLLSADQPVVVSFLPLTTEEFHANSSVDSESNSSHSDASSSRQTFELSPSLEASPVPSFLPQRPHIKPLRPALKQTTSWNSTSTRSSTHDLHVSFIIPTRPDPTTFTMHPLFEYTHLDHAPISCDTIYPPSPRTILDRATRAPIPCETLAEPATEPALYTSLTLKCALFPWEVVVRPSAAAPRARGIPFARRRPVTNLDVLLAVHETLAERVTEAEWAALGPRSRAQRRVSRAYEHRCVELDAGWDAGVRRVDWLEGRTRLVGVEMLPGPGKEGGAVATLIFKTPA
ncbi:hypothetical protein C8R46DRAFT_1309231 [Mycena filopes]|nr:hypothetical protein C8R46DRAFT_1309231 [Mycena filopes]